MDWEGALEEFRVALRLNPEYPTAHDWYALHLSRLGRHAEAGAEIEQALQLDPLSLIINTDAGEIFYAAASWIAPRGTRKKPSNSTRTSPTPI